MDNFKIIYQILKILEAALDYTEMDSKELSAERLGVTENHRYAILALFIDVGYITGVRTVKSLGGKYYDIRNIRITLKGVEYLEENSTMKKIAKLLKGIKESVPGL